MAACHCCALDHSYLTPVLWECGSDQTPQLEAIPDPTPEPAAQRGAVRGQREKKRRAQLDVDKDHKPETVISGNEIRKLLKDSAPLLRPRSELIGQFATLATAPIHVVSSDSLYQVCRL